MARLFPSLFGRTGGPSEHLQADPGPEGMHYTRRMGGAALPWPDDTAGATAGEPLAYLEQLLGEGLVHRSGDGVLLPWADLYRLQSDMAHESSLPLLALPPPAPLQPMLSAQGSLADVDLVIALEWRTGGNAPAQIGRRLGAVVEVGGAPLLLAEAAWRLVEAVANFARREPEARTQEAQERAWGRLRALAQEAEATLDTFLGKTIVLTPETLGLGLSRSDINGTQVVELRPEVDGAPQDLWLATFDRYSSVQGHYDLTTPDGGRLRIIPDAAVREVLAEIKALPARRVAGHRGEALLRNPYAVLGEHVARVLPPERFERARAAAGIVFFSFGLSIGRKDDFVAQVVVTPQPIGEGDATSQPFVLGDRQTVKAFAGALKHAMAQEALSFRWHGVVLEIDGDAERHVTLLDALARSRWVGDGPQLTFADVFDLSRYAERVSGFGAHKPVYTPYVARKSAGEGWVPENLETIVTYTPPDGGEPVTIVADDADRLLLKEAVDKAEAEGRSTIQMPGWPKPISTPEARAICEVFEGVTGGEIVPPESGGPAKPSGDADTDSRPPHLVIWPNIEAVDYVERRERITDPDPRKAPLLPASLLPTTRLKDHQRTGVAWLQHLWGLTPGVRGCVFADDMGLGKTLQLLTFIAFYLETRTTDEPVLIVAPVSLLENWQAEMARFFAPGFARVLSLHGDATRHLRVDPSALDEGLLAKGLKKFLKPGWSRDIDIVLTTYETLRDLEFSLAAVRWGIMVCDEAQKIKTHAALVTQAAKKQNARFRIACTGTPVENSLADLWCLFDFIQPGLLVPLNEFSRLYRRPIEAGTAEQKEAIDSLRALTAPQILRRMKCEVASLPAKIEDDACRNLLMSAEQVALYKSLAARARAVAELSGQGRGAAILSVLHRLRMACAHPESLMREDGRKRSLSEQVRLSPKLAWLLQTLEAIRKADEKVIIFTEFREMQRLIQQALLECFDIRASVVNGGTNVRSGGGDTRQQIIDRFQQKPGFNAIILSTTAVGFGVNIQAANHVIHFTRPWNPAKEDQATDRAYRIGQVRDVRVYYPTVTSPHFETFEARLDALLADKRKLAGDMLNGSEDVDLETLLG